MQQLYAINTGVVQQVKIIVMISLCHSNGFTLLSELFKVNTCDNVFDCSTAFDPLHPYTVLFFVQRLSACWLGELLVTVLTTCAMPDMLVCPCHRWRHDPHLR